MLKTTDGSVSAVTARYIKAATNRLQIYVTQDDEDIQDDKEKRHLFHSHSYVYGFANRGICWHDS